MRQLGKEEKKLCYLYQSQHIEILEMFWQQGSFLAPEMMLQNAGSRETEKEFTVIYACPHLYCATQTLMYYSEETLRSNISLVPHLDCRQKI